LVDSLRKVVIQNLAISVASKTLGFTSFIYIASIVSTIEYGRFVYVTMLVGLLPLFQFGSTQGCLVLLPKVISKKDGATDDFFWTYNTFSHLLQFLAVFALTFFDLGVKPDILIVIGFNFLASKYAENVQIYLNGHLQFKESNVIKSWDQIVRPIVVLTLFSSYKNIESIFIAQLLATIITFVVANYYVGLKVVSFEKKSFFTIKKLYRTGFFVYLVWAFDIVFRTVDRWFVAQFYSLDDLAAYGFVSTLAMNVWLLAMSFFAPYSQLLYKYVAENNFIEVESLVLSTNKKLYILLFMISLIAIILYPYVLKYFVHKYTGTEFLFLFLVLTSVLLSVNNMYIYYMISNNFFIVLLKYQVIILILNLFLNGLIASMHLDIVFFSYSTILTLGLYFILVRQYYLIDIKKRTGV